jgi:hypothetical protein
VELYFEKTHEILQTYEAQIQEQVQFSRIAEGLVFRRILSQAQCAEIASITENSQQMEETVEIIKKR